MLHDGVEEPGAVLGRGPCLGESELDRVEELVRGEVSFSSPFEEAPQDLLVFVVPRDVDAEALTDDPGELLFARRLQMQADASA